MEKKMEKKVVARSKNGTLMKDARALGLNKVQTKYLCTMVNIIIEHVHLHFDPGKENPSLLQYSYSLSGWAEYAKYNALSPEEQQKCDPEVRKCRGLLKGIIQLVSHNGNTTISQIVKGYTVSKGMCFPAGTVITTVKKSLFPWSPAIEEDCRELLDPENYGYSYAPLDFVNKKLNEAFPGRNLWAVALDFDSLEIYDLDKLPSFKRY